MITRTPAGTDQERYDRLIERVRKLVENLNEVIGGGATFGYLGNCDSRHDYRCWYVFLPHPGRVGTADDRLGGFGTNDLAGVESLVSQLHGAMIMAKYLRKG